MAGSGDLIFGASFNFSKGLAIAEKDLDDVVKRLQGRLDSTKLIAKIGFNIDESAKDTIQQISDVIKKSGLSGESLQVNVNANGFSELEQAIGSLNASLVNLNSLLSSTADSELQVAQGIEEQGIATANTTNTIQRQLMEQERVNKALRDTYDEQDRVKSLIERYHDTYEEQVLALVKLERQLRQNKKAQDENDKALDKGRISADNYVKRQQELVATQRELMQEKRQLTQIMTAEEKSLMAQEGSYNQLSQQLSLLKKAFKDMSEDGQMSDFGRELENAIQNLDARLKDMAADMGEFQRNVGNYAIAGQNGIVTTESLTAAISREAVTMQDLIDQTRILEEGKRLLSVNDAHYAETLSSVNAKLEENRRRLADVSDIMDKTPTSVSEAEVQNKRLVEALKQVDLGSEGAKERIKQLNEKIAENTKIIRENTPAIQEQTRAIEQQKKENEGVANQLLNMIGINANFGASLRGLGESNAGGVFVALGDKVKAFGKTLMGVVTNPWVLTFLGIAGVGATFKWWYDFNKGLIEASRLTKNFTGFSGDTADKVTADIQAMADKMGKDFNETIKATNILVHQFGLSWAEAIDLMQKGIVAGADMHGNLLSNIERFAPALRDAGVEASQFMAILAETRNGIFNERGIQDIVRGGTRLRAQTKLISESLDAVGISSKKMQKDLTDGTITMLQAVQQVSARLKELPQNSQEAGNIMRNVFGRTAAEGGMLLLESIADINTNLDTAIERMGEMGKLNTRQMNAQRELNEVLYSVFKMSDTTFAQMTTRVKIFATEALTEVIKKLADIANWFVDLYNGSKAVRIGVGAIMFVFESLWEVAKSVLRQLYDAFRALGTIIEGAIHFDPVKIAQGWKQGFVALKDNAVNAMQGIGDAAADAFGNRLNERLSKITIGLDADIPGVESDGNRGGNVTEISKKGGKGGSDTRLQTLNEIEQTLTTINAKYKELIKKEGQTKALADIKEIYGDTLEYINSLARQFNLAFEMPTSFKTLQEYRKAIKAVMEQLKAKGYQKATLELQTKISTADIDRLGNDIESKLKDLQSRIEQSKTAKEFYDKILSATGDVDIAANVTMSIYGEDGTALQAEIAQQITEMFGSFQVDVPVEIVSPENRVDYTALQRFLDEHRDEWADKDQFKALEKLASEGQKASAQQVEAWFKEIQKAKDYAQQRVDIETNLANKIASVRAMMLPKDVEETLISGMTEKSAQELDKLQYEAFKDSPMYIELFQDLEHASTAALTAMRDRLMALKGQWRNLNPTQIKELTNSIHKLDEQIIMNNPFKAIVDNLTSLRKMKSQKVLDENLKTELAKLQQAEEKLANASKEYAEAQTEVENAETDVAIARKKLNDAIDSGDYDAVKEAQAELNERVKILETIKETNADNMRIAKRKKDEAEDEYNKQKEITDAAEEEANARKETVQNIAAANQAIDQYQSIINDVLGDVREMMDALGADDLDLQFFDDIVQGLNQIVDAGQAAATAVGAFMTGDLFTGITQSISAVSGFITGFINLFYAGRVRKANKEIEKQQKLLEQLEYSYGRLQKAQEKLFGSDYISNFNQQLANLAAQAEAYRKQAEAERSKGKKADKDKIKDYEDSWRETMDEIKDMQDDLAAHFAGTDITSAARDFANSWLEARWAFEDTTEAMRGKFADMVQNMIVESMAAKIMESLLEPIYKEIKLAAADTNFTTDEIARIAAMTTETTEKMNNAMETMLEQLQAAGLDLSQMFSEGGTELTGIARDYATASEESINGLAQGVNTQNFYLSYVPSINENVSAIRILMEGGAVAQVGGDYNSLANEHLAQLPIIAANTLATAERCERAAVACEEMANNIRRVVASKGGTFVLRTTLN